MIYAIDRLPEEAVTELKAWYVNEKDGYDVKVVEDPYVIGTYALEVTRYEGKKKKPYTFHLLWYNNGFDEVDFDTFPPNANENNLQFFI